MILFPKSRVDAFRHTNTSKRWGQAFYDHMKLGKVTNPQDKEYCDRIYNADEALAKALVQSRIDKQN